MYLANELDFITLNFLDGQDLQLGQKVKGEVVHSITEDGFLDKDNVTSALLDLFADVEQVLTFFLEDFVHLAVVVDNDLVVDLKVRFCPKMKKIM